MKTVCIVGLLLLFTIRVNSQESHYFAIQKDSITLYVKDTLDYSHEFLNELAKWKLSDAYILEDDKIKMDSTGEYSEFYTGLHEGVKYEYFGENEDYEIHLTIRRINYTTIHYDAVIKSEEGREHIRGEAHGGISIFSEEIDEDDETGTVYACTEYYSNWENPEHVIRIDSEQNTRAKLIVEGNEDVYVDLYSCPTLKVKH